MKSDALPTKKRPPEITSERSRRLPRLLLQFVAVASDQFVVSLSTLEVVLVEIVKVVAQSQQRVGKVAGIPG
jgi:hypothetical protein